MLRAGIHSKMVQERLGHSSITITDRKRDKAVVIIREMAMTSAPYHQGEELFTSDWLPFLSVPHRGPVQVDRLSRLVALSQLEARSERQ